MIDWLAIIIALGIIATLVGVFGFLAWKINMPDPLLSNENQQYPEVINEKKKKEKNSNEQSKKKRKEQKKSKRENKDEEDKHPQQQRNKPLQTSEETDDEREESEQDVLTLPTQSLETSSKARKRNKNKSQTNPVESNTKNPITTRAPPATHPKSTSKDELEPTKQQTKVQGSNKQTVPTSLPTTTTTKKATQPVQKQQPQEQPFTVVGGNRHKTATPPLLQQQQSKSQVNTTLSVAPVQQSATTSVQHEQLAQRQQLPQKEASASANVSTTNPLPVKQQVSPKIADLIKVLPSSQAVVTELMSALDAFPLSTDELDIIMHKIANKQSVVKQDWNKLQHGQKFDPQAHIGQVLHESAKAYEDDLKTNSMQRIKDLTDELNHEKRRNNDLSKEKNAKEQEIQILHAQLDSVQHQSQPTLLHPQQKLQTLELQLQRLTEENMHLNQQLSSASNLPQNTNASTFQVQVLSEQIKKLSVENANWEKKANSNELLAKEAQKEKEDLIRYNEQLTQSLQNAEKDLKHIEEKHHQQMNDTRIGHFNEINEYKLRIQQLENDNEQLKREEIVHIEPPPTDIQTITLNNEEREEFEKEIEQLKERIQLNQQEGNYFKAEMGEYQKKIDYLETQRQSQENEFKQEIERLKKEKNNEQQQIDESRNNELRTLQTELTEVKSQSEEHLRQEREKQRQVLTNLLSEDLRNQLPNDNQDFDQWLSSYRQLFESSKQNLQAESALLKQENAQLHKNSSEIETQLKEIEKSLQSKEETLFTELKSKEALLENLRGENEQLTDELQHLRNEIQRLQSIHEASVSEARALKLQLDERFLVAANNTPSIVTADESFELVKQPSPSLSPIVVDIRAGQLNELIRSSKEALENQDSLTQQLDKFLNEMHHSGLGEISASKTDDSTVSSSSSDQQS